VNLRGKKERKNIHNKRMKEEQEKEAQHSCETKQQATGRAGKASEKAPKQVLSDSRLKLERKR
jgi:hypothetical protein